MTITKPWVVDLNTKLYAFLDLSRFGREAALKAIGLS